MHDWLCFMEHNLFYVGSKENFSVVITGTYKYSFIAICLEYGIKKMPLFSF